MSFIEIANELLLASVDEITSYLILLFTGLAAVGVLAGAIVDIIKLFLQPRKAFNQYMVHRILYSALTQDDAEQSIDPVRQIESMIVTLSTGGEMGVFYAQTAANVVSQLRTSVGIVLADPIQEFEFFEEKCISRKLISAWAKPIKARRVEQYIRNLGELHGCAKGAESENGSISEEQRKRLQEEVDRDHTYLASIIDSNLSGLQLRMEFWWKFWMQLLAVIVSAAIISTAVCSTSSISVPWVAFSIVGGLLAPVSHDILGKLGKARVGVR